MWLWPQSWQAATCPPSAAVRQHSMADIALSWPKLRWPALALRQAGPWSRKISATSNPFRSTGAQLYEAFFFFPLARSRSSGLLTARKVELST